MHDSGERDHAATFYGRQTLGCGYSSPDTKAMARDDVEIFMAAKCCSETARPAPVCTHTTLGATQAGIFYT